MMFLKGILALTGTLAVFTIFSLRCPKGDKAMSGLANAAIASFLVEAICKYILGDFAGIGFFAAVGDNAGSMGGPVASILVGISMGTNPVLAVACGAALRGFGILPGFVSGYLMYFILREVEKRLPDGVDTIAGAIIAASGAYGIAYLVNPVITVIIGSIGGSIMAATEQTPILMGLILGGVIKIVCTSPLSSMALTAMLQLTGLPMGIAAIACFGGSFTNGMLFHKLKLGNKGNVVAVMLEPLTQANIVTRNPIPIYVSNFLGGGLSGVGAAIIGIICNAPGTASPIPGMLAPFAFNPAYKVLLALGFAAIAGTIAGMISACLFLGLEKKYQLRLYHRAAELS